MYLMELDNICHTYSSRIGVVHALKHINLQVDAGEKIAIVGHSGSGKSTLANIMCCLLTPTCGTYRIRGQNTNLLTKNELALIRSQNYGVIFQNYCLIKRFNVLENVMYPLLYDRTVSKKDMICKGENALFLVGMDSYAMKKPNQLSGGQQQLVAVARAIVNNPPIIIADEPTANLDVENENRIISCLSILNQKGTTLITITHSKTIASQYPRILQLENGIATDISLNT